MSDALLATTALIPFLGHGHAGAAAWVRMDKAERRRLVMAAARGKDTATLWSLTEAWVQRQQEDGVRGVEDTPRPGRPHKHPLAAHLVAPQASQSPECCGPVQSCWTVGLLTAFLVTRVQVALSPSSVRRSLRARGWRWARPRLAPAHKTDPQAAEKEVALATAQAEAARGRAPLLSVDACALHLLPVIRARWMKGPRVRVPTPGANRKRAFVGALDAASGAWLAVDHDRKVAVHCVAFLRRIAAAYPSGPLYLALDNVTMHEAKVVRAWLAAHPRVQVLWVPTQAAHEANPVERIWGLMKEAVAATRLAGRIDDLSATAHAFFADLAAHPVSLPVAA